MADPAEPVHAPAPAKEAEAGRRTKADAHHAALEGRRAVRAEPGYRAMLGGRPALAAQLETAKHLAGRPEGPQPVQRAPNRTGLPDRLKAGVEALSGLAMHDVRVHFGSSQPEELGAHAFTRGTDIHVAPGQERHLPHEAWHVVQQKQGRVKATTQMKGVCINDDAALEREADALGARAASLRVSCDSAGLPGERSPGRHGDAVAQLLSITQIGPMGDVERELPRLSDGDLRLLIEDPARLEGSYRIPSNNLAALQEEARTILETRTRRPARNFQMIDRANAATPHNSLLAATEPDYHQQHQTGQFHPGPLVTLESEFSPQFRNPERRQDLGRIWGRDQGGGRVPAQQFVGTDTPQEYLHRQGHGLGGDDTVANTNPGSAQANTEMIPIEAAVAGRADLTVRVVFQTSDQVIQAITMEVYRTAPRTLLYSHAINGQQRYFTREQYQELSAQCRVAIDPAVMRQLLPGEVDAILALQALSQSQ